MKLKEMTIAVGLSVTGSLAVIIASWFLWLRPPHLVSFDIKSTTNQFLFQSARLDLNEEQQKALLGRYNKNLADILSAHAREGDEAIIVQAANVSGIPDITPEIKSELAQAMKGGE